MKKAFVILLAICMMIPVFAVSSFAVDNSQATNVDKMIPTVYVGTTVTDSTADKGTRSNPYDNFVDAYGAVIANSTTGKAKIVLLDDINFFGTDDTPTVSSSVAYWYLSDFNYQDKAGTVYVCGEYDTVDNQYPKLNFYYDSNGVVVTFGANMVFYDITLGNDSGTTKKNLWIAAALHDLTFGFNVSKTANSVNLVGGGFNKNGATYYDGSKDGSVINFYSGVYGDVFLTLRSGAGHSITSDDPIIFNLYGGQINNINTTATTSQNTVTINVYEGTVLKKIDNPSTNGLVATSAFLNFYNNKDSFVEDMTTGVTGTFADGTGVVYKAGSADLRAPSYAVDFCGVQDKSEGEKFSVRLVGTVDSLEFDYVGFEIDINGVDYSNTSKRVYTSIQGAGDTIYTAAQLGSNYIYTRTITGIPKSETIKFTVRPFIRIGDIDYYGQECTVTYTDGVIAK